MFYNIYLVQNKFTFLQFFPIQTLLLGRMKRQEKKVNMENLHYFKNPMMAKK